MTKIIYKDLGYILNGIFFEVYNQLGYGHREKAYCQAIIECLKRDNINFIYQFKIPLIFYKKEIGKRYLDFLIDDKIVIEVKTGNKATDKEFRQIKEYIKLTNYKLGLLVVFREKEVKIYRVLNLY